MVALGNEELWQCYGNTRHLSTVVATPAARHMLTVGACVSEVNVQAF